jgi:putative ABC transport system permease protein
MTVLNLFCQTLIQRVGELPQVESVSAGNPPPHVGWNVAYEAEGQATQAASQRPRTMDAVVMPGYFRTFRTSTFAPPRGWVYLPQGQPAYTELVLMIRFKEEMGSLVRDVQQLVWQEQPALPVHWNRLLDDLIAERYWQPRVYPRLFAAFAALAFAVALVGVYGVVAFASARRTREFGIRLAVGSPPSKVWRLVVWQGLRLAAAGTAVGMLAALGLMRAASALFFGTSPTDPTVYGVCGVIAVAAALLASAGPAFRASRIEPVSVLRCD